MASLIETIVGFLKDNLQGTADDPPLPGKLRNIQSVLDQLTHVDTSNNGLVDWLAAIRTVISDVDLRDTVLVRALQLRAPQLAEALVMAGLIEIEFAPADTPRASAFRIAWDRLDAYLRTPGNEALNALLSRVQDVNDFEIAQVLAGKLLFSPVSIKE